MDLREFLIKAKKQTYANKSAKETKLADGSKELTFEEGPYFYRDRYFGLDPFSGEEIIFHKGKAAWVMNYAGGTNANLLLSKKSTRF